MSSSRTGKKPYDGDSVLADVLKPNKLQSARALAVDTLLLVFSDDNIPQRCTGAEDEDSIVIAALAAGACARTTVILGPASIKSFAGSDLDRGAVRVVGGMLGEAPLVAETG